MEHFYNPQGQELSARIRLARPEDAGQITALLAAQHGMLYYNQNYYDEHYVRELIASRTLIAAVAEIGDGMLVGMECATGDSGFDGCLLLCLRTVHKAYRGYGLSKRLTSFLNGQLDDHEYSCSFAHCLTLDIISQNNLIQYGYTPTGLLMNRYLFDPAAVNLVGTQLPTKRTHLVYVHPIAKRSAGMLSVPAGHAAFIRGLYDQMGVACTLDDGLHPAETTEFSSRQDDTHNYCELIVRRAGADFGARVRGLVEQNSANPHQSFNALIDMCDASAAYAFEQLRALGFFFTGLQPLVRDAEYLLMHLSMNGTNFEGIVVSQAFEAAMDYIRCACALKEGARK